MEDPTGASLKRRGFLLADAYADYDQLHHDPARAVVGMASRPTSGGIHFFCAAQPQRNVGHSVASLDQLPYEAGCEAYWGPQYNATGRVEKASEPIARRATAATSVLAVHSIWPRMPSRGGK